MVVINIFKVLMICFLCLIIVGCASVNRKDLKAQHSGFLSDYSKLKAQEGDPTIEYYFKPDFSFANYNTVILDRVLIWLKDDAEYKGIDPDELKALTDYFREAFIKALGSDYPMVTKPDKNTLRIRTAITNLTPSKPELSVLMLAIPYASVVDLASGKITGNNTPPYIGETSIEAEFLDSMTNEQLGAYIERRIGKKYDIALEEGLGKAIQKGYDSYFRSFTKWGYAKQAFDYWAMKLRKKLDETHGRSTLDNKNSNTDGTIVKDPTH